MSILKEPKSLYDYLGYPAGKQVGKQVYVFAKKINSPTDARTVVNRKYEGIVMLYEETFLRYYFTVVNPSARIAPVTFPTAVKSTFKPTPFT